MTTVGVSTDRAALAAFFRKDPLLHLYELGDLDPFFWPSCRWHTRSSETGELLAVVLEYACPMSPTVIALGRADDTEVAALLAAALPALPARFYAHLSPGLDALLGERPRRRQGRHLKMALADRSALRAAEASGAVPLGPADLPEIEALLAAAYPENWFDPRMLETGRYLGLREDGVLSAMAGVHVFSLELGVAALGNVTTLPARRGRGLGGRVTAALCQRLATEVEHVGLHVQETNVAAIALYRRLGFVEVAPYEEWWVGGAPSPT